MNNFQPLETNQEINKPDSPQKPETITPLLDTFFRVANEAHQTQEDAKIVLTENKYCFIKYPKKMNEKDILILKKWIELIELTV